MNKTVFDWLTMQCGNYRDGTPRTILQYLSELVSVNRGSIDVTQIGNVLEDSKAVYGRIGLTIEEAMNLLEMKGVLSGFFMSVSDSQQAQELIKGKIQEEINRVIREGRPGNIILPTPEESKELGQPLNRLKKFFGK